MRKSSIVVLPDTNGHLNYTGEAIRTDGWYGCRSGIQTLAVYLNNFQGKIIIEATLLPNPSDSDWFVVKELSLPDYSDAEYLINKVDGREGVTGTIGFNIEGNYTFIRAKMDRSHLKKELWNPHQEGTQDFRELGYIDLILMNF